MKLVKPNERSPERGAAPLAYDKAREAAIEKKRSHYIELKCKHFTTWEMDELFCFGRPARNKYWCDQCGKWVVKMPKKPVKDYPDEPLF